jgi:hypothetical protein
MLNERRRRCLVATFDLASYYDEIDATFLVSRSFVEEIAHAAESRSIPFARDEFVSATRTLLNAYRRYRSACHRLTGVRTSRGIPIGCLSSKVISNVALAPLDTYVHDRPQIGYYARYVDDIILVADATTRSPSSARAIARAFLPVARGPQRRASGDIVLDAGLLRRPGSRLRLQRSKLRGYLLAGRRGRDFLDTVERDVKLIASERRAFLLPDGLGSESPLTALFVGTDSESPVQVLREVDRLKVERYAASVSVSKTSVGVELLDMPDSAQWCRRQLAPLAGHMTSPEQWLEFLALALRALTVCIRAGDTVTAWSILRRHSLHFSRLGLIKPRSPATWNGAPVRWALARRGLFDWYENRRLEEIASSIPLTEIVAGTTAKFLKRLLGKPLRVGQRTVGAVGIANRAELLYAADLRTADRETDTQRLRGRTPFRVVRRWGELGRTLRRDPLTADRVTQIGRLLSVCRTLKDAAYRRTSPIELLLMPRPPSQFDVACRWAKGKQPMDDLWVVTNAVRGTRYFAATVRQPDPSTIDITTFDRYLSGRLDDVQVVLGNLRTETSWWSAAAQGTPILTRARMAAIGRIVNEAIRIRNWKSQPTLLVLPELSLPARLLRALAQRLVHEGVNLVAGLEYSTTPSGVVNEAVGVFAPGFNVAAVWWWPKTLPSRGELRELMELGLSFATHPGSPVAVSTDFGALSTLICSELLDVRLRGNLLGRIDLLVVPAWNPDTATFDHTVQTTANDLHCYTAVANNALFSDCRLQVPARKRHERDACRLISRIEDEIIAVAVSADMLRKFQLASLADPTLTLPEFKPLPPGYEFRRT